MSTLPLSALDPLDGRQGVSFTAPDGTVTTRFFDEDPDFPGSSQSRQAADLAIPGALGALTTGTARDRQQAKNAVTFLQDRGRIVRPGDLEALTTGTARDRQLARDALSSFGATRFGSRPSRSTKEVLPLSEALLGPLSENLQETLQSAAQDPRVKRQIEQAFAGGAQDMQQELDQIGRQARRAADANPESASTIMQQAEAEMAKRIGNGNAFLSQLKKQDEDDPTNWILRMEEQDSQGIKPNYADAYKVNVKGELYEISGVIDRIPGSPFQQKLALDEKKFRNQTLQSELTDMREDAKFVRTSNPHKPQDDIAAYQHFENLRAEAVKRLTAKTDAAREASAALQETDRLQRVGTPRPEPQEETAPIRIKFEGITPDEASSLIEQGKLNPGDLITDIPDEGDRPSIWKIEADGTFTLVE